MQKIDLNKYREICYEINNLINAELESIENVETTYPKLVIMYEFFRLIRGEAFLDLREPDPAFQNELYGMEDQIFEKLKKIKDSIQNKEYAKACYDNLISIGLRLE